MIEVRLFATFRNGREKIIFMEQEEIKTAGDILKALSIEEKEVAILLINGRHKKPQDAISDGDVVALFPPVGGG